jgi:hypothetical protein
VVLALAAYNALGDLNPSFFSFENVWQPGENCINCSLHFVRFVTIEQHAPSPCLLGLLTNEEGVFETFTNCQYISAPEPSMNALEFETTKS